MQYTSARDVPPYVAAVAVSRSVAGTSMPSALAAFTFTTKSNWLVLVPHQRYLDFESGGHSVRTAMGLRPLCTVGAAEFEPPASGRIALFSIAMEFDVFSPALPEVVADDVVQLVSCFSLDGAVDWATAAPATTNPAKIATANRSIIIISRQRKIIFSNPKQNVSPRFQFHRHWGALRRLFKDRLEPIPELSLIHI